MPVPSPRNKILPARGNYVDLAAGLASLLDGEICYAIDQDQYYQNESGTLVSVGATKAQGALADSALQSGDNISELVNDTGYITQAEVPPGDVTSVNTQTGDVVLDAADVGAATTAQGVLADTSLQPGDNISELTNDTGYITDYTVTSEDVVAHESDLTIAQSQVTNLTTDLAAKADLVGGFIPTSQIPAIAITEFLGSVGSEVEMLALVGQQGDWCLRTDKAVGYVIIGSDPSQVSNWESFTVPGSAVTTINSQVGDVVLGFSDVGAASAAQGALADSALQPGDAIQPGDAVAVTGDNMTGDLTLGTDKIVLDADTGDAAFNGSVGIGTTDPIYKLDVRGEAGVELFNNTGGGDVLNLRPSLGDANKYNMSISSFDHSGEGVGPADGISINAFDGVSIATGSSTARQERFRVSEGGNVGIGTNDPSQLLELASTAPNIRLTDTVDGYSEIDGNAASLILNADKGNDKAGSIIEFAVDNITRMQINDSGTVRIGQTSTNTPGFGNTTTGAAFEKTTSGNALFISRSNSCAAFFNRNSNGDLLRFFRSGSQVGRIDITSTTANFIGTSDYRLKENVTDLSNGIDRLKLLTPRRFNFIAEPDQTIDGFIAHEISDAVPEAVFGKKDAMEDQEFEVTPAVLDEDGNVATASVMETRSVISPQGIDQSKLVPLLTAALQEAIAKIETLEQRLNDAGIA